MTLREVVVAGIGETKFGKHMGRAITDIGAEACIKAIKDAGVGHKQVQVATGGYACQWNAPLGQYFALPQIVLREIGITDIPVMRTECGCATGSVAFRDIWYRIATGEYDVGLAFGLEQMNVADSSSILHQISDHIPERDGDFGLTAAGIYGLMARRMMEQNGVTREQLAQVVVKNRRFGSRNPLAQFGDPVTLEQVLNGRMISDPLTLYMCCGRGDGAAAAVLMDAATARRHGVPHVRVAANVLTSGSYLDDLDFVTFDGDVRAAAQAYEMAGIGPEDLDIAEIHDSFAPAEIKHYEDLGFCARGDGGRFIEEGRSDMGGDIAVNTSGGLLAKGHIIGATGISQIGELVKQLRGSAGDRQVDGAKVGLQHNSGGYVHTEFCSCAINILTV
ncbi:thiolase family protein [Nocardia australiensis]|uniref:thiolase family protein n=1 Tax=Nocardia australiensis TaxID=2887191 RepID=UPI001D14E010|nr:thiolase family protein [Nocardia australiensis]